MSQSTKMTLSILLLFTIAACSNFQQHVRVTQTPPNSVSPQFEKQPTPEFTPLTPSLANSETAIPPITHTPTAQTSATPAEVARITSQTVVLDSALLTESINKITSQAGGRWHIIIRPIGGANLYASLPDQRINIASVVKVPIALLFFKALEERGIDDGNLAAYLQSAGYGGRTFDQLLDAMLVKSEEEATTTLLEYIPLYLNIPAQMAEWKLQTLDLVSRRFTAEGVAALFERLYQGDFISPAARQLILNDLNEYTPNDETRIGVLSNVLPENYHIYNKRGSLLTPYVVADCAILENEIGDDYLIIIFAYQGEPKTTYEVLEQAQGEIALAFWQSIQFSNQP